MGDVWAELKSWPRGMQVLCGGLIIILVIGVLSLILDRDLEVWVIIMTPLWMLAIGVWIVFRDSKKRWPDASAFQRYTNLITFKR